MQLQLQLDVVAEETVHALFHAGEQVVELQHAVVQHLPAAEGEELAGERRSPLADLLDLRRCLRAGSSPPIELMASSVWKEMAVSRLLKTWAMPPARRPMASMLCDWAGCSSLCRISRCVSASRGVLRGLLGGEVVDSTDETRVGVGVAHEVLSLGPIRTGRGPAWNTSGR